MSLDRGSCRPGFCRRSLLHREIKATGQKRQQAKEERLQLSLSESWGHPHGQQWRQSGEGRRAMLAKQRAISRFSWEVAEVVDNATGEVVPNDWSEAAVAAAARQGGAAARSGRGGAGKPVGRGKRGRDDTEGDRAETEPGETHAALHPALSTLSRLDRCLL